MSIFRMCICVPRLRRTAVLLACVMVTGIGCSQQAKVPPPSADASDILKNSDGTIGPMKGTPGNQ